MNRLYNILAYVFITFVFANCNKPKITVEKHTYNQKANELIVQIMATSGCNCILEIPKKDYSKMSETEKAELKRYYIKWLKLNKKDNVDSILKTADAFKWDENLLKENNLKLIRYDSSKENKMKFSQGRTEFANRIFKICPNGARSIQRPILDNKFKTAIIRSGEPFSCFPSREWVYKFESGRWVGEK